MGIQVGALLELLLNEMHKMFDCTVILVPVVWIQIICRAMLCSPMTI